jgi:hypothetical protein
MSASACGVSLLAAFAGVGAGFSGVAGTASTFSAASLNLYVPTSVTVSRLSPSTCRVTWTASSAAGAPASLTYDVGDGTSTLATAVNALTVDLSTAANVTPVVSARAGTWTSPTATVSAAGCGSAPGAPTGLTLTPGNSQVAASWTAPASNGGATITSYTATAAPGGATCTSTGTPPATACTFTGLTNGTTYTVTVKATNTVGTGPASASATATPGNYAGQVTSTPGLVGYWKLADAAGSSTAADSSGHGRTGTVTGGVTFGQTSRPMPADPSTTAAFAAGTGAGITVGDVGGVSGAYDFTGRSTFSIAAWVRSNAPAYGYAYPDIAYKKRYNGPSSQEGWHLTLNDTQATTWSPGTIMFARFSASVFNGVSAPLPLSTWTHVVATYDGTTMLLYFNNQLVASATSTTSVIDTTEPLVVGRIWEDRLAHVAIWNTGLTAAHVSNLYTQAGSPVAATAPQAPRYPNATAGPARVTVAWTSPAYNGLSTITSYTATATPGGAACTTSTTSCVITGLIPAPRTPSP